MNDNNDNSLAEANRKAKAIYRTKMQSGEHSFKRRLSDFLSPVGNDSKIACLLAGHKWYLKDPEAFQFHTPTIHEIKHGIEFPDNPRWACYCQRCGAGSYFQDPPDDVFEVDYWCLECESVVGGTDLIGHAKGHLEEHNRWPGYWVSDPDSPYQNND